MIEKDQRLVVDLNFATFLTIYKDKEFKAIGRIDWTSQSVVQYARDDVVGFVWQVLLPTITPPVSKPGTGDNFEDFQKAYQDYLQLVKSTEGYKLTK